MKVQFELIHQNSDSRGSVWEPLSDTELKSQGNCHVVTTQPGGIRGNHYHRVGTEIATQCGPALIVFRDETGTHRLEVNKGEAMRLLIPPGVPHAFKNNGDEPNLLVAFNTEVFNADSPDVVREVILES